MLILSTYMKSFNNFIFSHVTLLLHNILFIFISFLLGFLLITKLNIHIRNRFAQLSSYAHSLLPIGRGFTSQWLDIGAQDRAAAIGGRIPGVV